MKLTRRIVFACLAAAFLSGVWFYAASFVADLRVRYAVRALDSSAQANALAAALKLRPSRADYRRDLAWALGAGGDLASMRREFRQALRWNPASAGTWLEYAEALAHTRRLDAEFDLALERAAVLAPNSQPLRQGVAWLGVNYWNQGSLQARQIWARAMAHTLRIGPDPFLKRVLLARREVAFCGYVGLELGLDMWCRGMNFGRMLCDAPQIRANVSMMQACRGLGLLPADDPNAKP